jgi:hypothetical protein
MATTMVARPVPVAQANGRSQCGVVGMFVDLLTKTRLDCFDGSSSKCIQVVSTIATYPSRVFSINVFTRVKRD